ncbi:MAG TPA: MtnX-like HAD-IB family phosphatase [Candidatus Acidoferrum sp.]|nr:MtnX-like HAD-IB family phosphatase [Candidatus Acidoferrum sp.]
MKSVVFCDFDGTISRRDVGYHLFHHFSHGENEKLIPDWVSGRLSSRDCLRQEAAMVHAGPDEIYAFLDTFEIDPGFKSFEEICRANGTELYVVSDGLDFYISYILGKNGLNHLPVKSNVGRLENDGITVSFPLDNQTCQRCGTCKGEIIERYRRASSIPCQIAFVGDGYSDACAVRAADLILAKKDLEQYCLKHNIAYNWYRDFFDVTRLLDERGFLSVKGNVSRRGE